MEEIIARKYRTLKPNGTSVNVAFGQMELFHCPKMIAPIVKVIFAQVLSV